MSSFRTRSTLSPTRQLKRVGAPTGGVGTGAPHWWMLGTGAPLAACGSDGGGDPAPTSDVVPNVDTSVIDDKALTVANPLQDATVVGNETIIDLGGVFDNGSGGSVALTLTASLGTVGLDIMLTLSDAVFIEGTHTITVAATDANGDKAEEIFELVSDKTPTIAAPLPDAILASNTTVLDLDGVFAGGSGDLKLTSSFGSIGDNKPMLGDSALPDTLTLTFTATDADGDAAEETVVVVSDKTLITANKLQDATIVGNDVTIDLNEVFESNVSSSVALALEASLGTVGTNDKLTIRDSEFTEGTHTITITASDGGSDTVKETVVLVSDKTPTVSSTFLVQLGVSPTYDSLDPFVSWDFRGGSGEITLTASHGTTIGTDDKLTLGDYAATEGTYTITLTATDEDGDTVENTHIIITNHVPTIANALADTSFKGNGSTTINLAGVFGSGSGKLTLTASTGTIGSDNSLTLVGSELVNGVNIFTITATDTDGDTARDLVKVISDKFPSIANTLDDATVVGNDAIIDINGVFESVYGDHTLAASLGSIGPDNMLTISDAEFTEGTHMITVTATDADDDETEEVFALVSDKTPTIATALPDTILKSNTMVIDLNGVFGGGSGGSGGSVALALSDSLGIVGSDGMFTLSDAVFTENTHTITFTATDADGDAVEETVVVVSDQTLIVATPLQDATVVGNDTTIDLSGLFESSVGTLSLTASLGAVGLSMLTISDSELTEGTHTITITANDTLEETFVLVSDKTPTVANTLADTSINSNSGTIIDLASVFDNGSGMRTLTASAGMVSDNTLTLVGSDLVHGVNAFTVTATDADGDATTDVFQIHATKTFSITEDAVTTVYGAFQHSTQTFDVEELFTTAATSITFATSTLPSGISLSGSTLSFANTALTEGVHTIIIIATDDNLTVSHTLTYALGTIMDQFGYGSDSTYIGTTLADAITDNSFRNNDIVNVYLHGGVGGDTISNNIMIGENLYSGFSFIGDTYNAHSITFEGGDGHDTISNNTLTASDVVRSITFDGGAGNDTISGNTLDSGNVSTITFNGGAGNDTISGNTLDSGIAYTITFDGGAGNDTISGNTISANRYVSNITFDGGAGNDTISDNHFETTWLYELYNVFNGVTSVTLRGGEGDDVFSGNTASQANGKLASMTIDGGDGEDTVVFRSIAFEYAGISDWIDSSDRWRTTITLTGDGAAVTLTDVETIAFADGTNFTAPNAWAVGYGGISYDLANAFPNADTTSTAYSTDRGNIGPDEMGMGNTLTLAGSELAHGANPIVITAIAVNKPETIVTITVNAVRKLEIIGLKQHSQQTFDLSDVFAETTTTTYTGLALPNGVTFGNGNLIFDNAVLDTGEQLVTVTATDGSDAHTLTLSYTLDAIKDQTVSDRGSNTTYTGTTLADAIVGNMFTSDTNSYLTRVRFDGGAGDDTISSNTLTARDQVYFITFDGGAGDDVFRDNIVNQTNGGLATLTIDGGDGEDTVVFRSVASEYAGISQWIDGVTRITLIGDGAAVTLIDVETISFADGASYNAADAWVKDNGETLYDLTKAFPDGTFTAYSADSGTIGTGIGESNTLTLSGTELAHGANTILVTATANDSFGTETTETITVNAVKTLKINGRKQHDQQTFDLGDVFVETTTTTYNALNLPSGVTLADGTLTFNNTLSLGNHPITITATDGNDALTLTLNYALEAIKDQTGDGSYSSYTGTTLADAISGNAFVETNDTIVDVYLYGGDGNDTISSNTLTARDAVRDITFDGGAGDDVFRDNIASQANGESASLTIDGGDGEDTVVFRSVASEYAGLSQWIDGVTTITLSGDGAAVTLFDVETLSFADGVSYNAADAWVVGNEETLYDLTNKFSNAEVTFTAYSSNSGTITGKTLTLAGTEFSHGVNTILVTATANDSFGTETTKTITVNAAKTLKINGAKQHDQQTFDLGDVFAETTTYKALNLPSGVILADGTLTFNNTLSVGNHLITIAATDSSEALTFTLTYGLEAIMDQSGVSNTTYTGTTLADAITGNAFVETNGSLTNIDLDGGAGNDTISNNSLSAYLDISQTVFYVGNRDLSQIKFDGGDGDDTISNNSFTASNLYSITFAGGDGDDTISKNTITATDSIYSITFDGGDGDDTISDNHLGSTGQFYFDEIDKVTLEGGAGNDVFRNNTAIQSNSRLAELTIDGGADPDGNDSDKVYFALESSMFTITGSYSFRITVTDNEMRTKGGGDTVDSYAKYILTDIEELFFAGELYEF